MIHFEGRTRKSLRVSSCTPRLRGKQLPPDKTKKMALPSGKADKKPMISLLAFACNQALAGLRQAGNTVVFGANLFMGMGRFN